MEKNVINWIKNERFLMLKTVPIISTNFNGGQRKHGIKIDLWKIGYKLMIEYEPLKLGNNGCTPSHKTACII